MAKKKDPKIAALLTLQQRVYVPAFIKACAAHGLVLTNQRDVEEALNTAAILKRSQAKGASRLLHRGAAALRKQAGIPEPAQEAKTASAADLNELHKLLADPKVRKAITTLGQ